MNLKPGWIYLIKTNWGEAHEGEFRACIRGVNIIKPLPFPRSSICPGLINDEDIDWVEEICPMTPFLTETEYLVAISKINK